jgi:hypothetical protein
MDNDKPRTITLGCRDPEDYAILRFACRIISTKRMKR